MNEEPRLRDLFRRMKDADRAHAPSFDGLLRRRRSSIGYWPPAAAAALALLCAALWWPRAPGPPPTDLLAWRSPTAFLLEPLAPALLDEPIIGVQHEVPLCESCF